MEALKLAIGQTSVFDYYIINERVGTGSNALYDGVHKKTC